MRAGSWFGDGVGAMAADLDGLDVDFAVGWVADGCYN